MASTTGKRNRCENFTENEVNALVSAYEVQENFLNLEYSTLSSSDRYKIWNQIGERISSIDGIRRTGKQCATKIKNLKKKSANEFFSSESKDDRFVESRVLRQASSECVFCSQCVDPLDTPQLSVELVDAVCTVLRLVPTIRFNWKKCLLHCSLCAPCHRMVLDAQELMIALDRLQNKIDRISTSIENSIRKGHFNLQTERIITEESSLTGVSSLPSPSELRAQLATFLKLRPSKFRCEESKEEILDVGIIEDSIMSNFDNAEIEETTPLLDNIESTLSWSTKHEPDMLLSVPTNQSMMLREFETYQVTLHENVHSDQNHEAEEKRPDSDSNCAEDGSDDEERNRPYSIEQDDIDTNSDEIVQLDNPYKKCIKKRAPNFSKNEIRVLWTEFRKREDDIKTMPHSFRIWSQISKLVSGVSKLKHGRSATQCKMKIKNMRNNSFDVEEFLKEMGEDEEESVLEASISECLSSPEDEYDERIRNRRASKFSEAEVNVLCTEYLKQQENLTTADKIQRQNIWEQIAKIVSYVTKVERHWKTCRTKIKNLKSSHTDLSSLVDTNAPTIYQHLVKPELSGEELNKTNLSKFNTKTGKHEKQDRNSQFQFVESRKMKHAPVFSLEEMRVLYQEAKKWDSTLKDKQKNHHEIYCQIAKLVSKVWNIKRSAEQCYAKLKNMKRSVVDYDKIFEQEEENQNTDIILQKSHNKDLYCPAVTTEHNENEVYFPKFSQNHKRQTTHQYFRRLLLRTPHMEPHEYEVVLPTGVVLLQHLKLQLTRCDDLNVHIKTCGMNSRLEILRAVRLKQLKARLHLKRRTETISKAEKRSQLIGECLKRRQKKRQLVERNRPDPVKKRKRRKGNEIGDSDHLEYTCDVNNCGEKFKGAMEIERHVRYEHAIVGTPPSHHCNIESCWRSFYTIQGLERHKTRCHDESVRNFLCDICSKSYISLSILKAHKLNSHNNRPFCCEICGNRYKRKDELNNHQSKIHGDLDPERFKPDRVTCPICSFRCVSASFLRKHIKRHNGGFKLTCSEVGCHFKTDTMSQLKVHKLAHSDERNCRCHLCPMSYKRIAELNRHLRRHAGILNHKCPYCEKAFAVKSYLTNHINVIHDRQIRFTCQDCGEGFPILKYYHRHRILAHKESNGVTGIVGRRANGEFAIGNRPVNRIIDHQSQLI